MTINRVFAQVAVKDITASVAWYTRLFDRTPDSTPMDGLAEWYLVQGGGVQVFADKDRVGHAWITLETTGLDDHVTRLKAKHIEVGPTTKANYVRIAIVVDPDGNHITFAEPL